MSIIRIQPYINERGNIDTKPAEYDEHGQIIPDPSWIEFLHKHRSAMPGRKNYIVTERRQVHVSALNVIEAMTVAKAEFDGETIETESGARITSPIEIDNLEVDRVVY